MNFSRLILCSALLILGSGSLFGQVSGTKTIPTDYATIADFVTAINTSGIGAGGVTLDIPSGYTETAPAGGFTITATGTVANPIVIHGVGGAPKPIITASAGLTAGALNDGIIKLIGSDYVTISGLDLRENAANTTTAAGTNNMTEFGIALFYNTITDGCQNVTITDNTIGLGATYQNAMGIYANSTHNATAMAAGATATTGNNNNLTVKRNTISSVNLGIVVLGPTAAADHASDLIIGGAPGDGNTITFGLNGTFSGFNAVSGTVNGILFRNVKNTNCTFNTLTSSGTVTSGTLNGIQLQAFSNTPTGTFSQVISNNTFNLMSAVVGGNVVGITSPSGSASATSTLDISNNQFNGFGHSVASPTGSLTFISTVSTNFTTTINSNSFNNLTVTTTGSVTFVSHSFSIPGGGSSTASNNTIATQFTKTGAGGSVVGFTTGASTPNSAFYTLSNNNFSNISVTGATSLTFINNTDGSGTACSKTISGNTFSNILGGTSAIIGFTTTYWGGATSTVANNTFSNISGQSSITAINIGNSFAGTVATTIHNNTISSLTSTGAGSTVTGITTSNTASSISINNNTINGLSSTGASLVSAIAVTGSTLTNVNANRIYGLSSSNAGGTVFGISITGGTGVNTSNNIISGLTAPIASGTDVIRGININSSSSSAVYGVYYNSVYLNATSSGTNFGTAGIYHQASATASTAALDMRNNIIINESAAAGTGFTVAFRRSAVQLNNFASASNRNLLYAGAPSATHLLMYDGTTPYQTMLTYQAAVLPREANSFSGEAPFVGSGYGTAGNFFISLTGVSSDFLRPVSGITTQVESGASTISGITTDYTGTTRSGTPDVGAYEFSGTTPAPVITLNSVTPPTTTQCVATARLVSVNITTASGTITGATIGYSVNGVPQTNIVMTNVSGTTWEGTIPVPTPVNGTIVWGVAATNSLVLNGSYTGTPYADEPLFGATASATASSSTVCASSPSVLTAKLVKSGPVTIGTGSTVSTGSAAQTPFYGGYGGVKTQYLIRASELTALGLNAGNITQMSLNITGAGSTLSGLGISMDHTALTALTNNIENIATQVYSIPSFVPTVGANNFVFSTPFNWDGTSNVIVSFCWSNNNTSNTASNLSIVSTAYVSANARYVDSRTAAEVCGYTGNTTPGGWNGGATTLSSRPIFTFIGNATQTITSVSWSDGVGTIGTTNPLSVSPTATTTYTANITAAGCTFAPSPSTTVTVNPLPTAPTATNSAQCGVQVPTANVTSTSGLPTPSFNWYAASSGGTALQSGTSATFTSTVSTTTTFYVSELNTVTGCESTRTPVTVNVSTPDAVSLTASVASICVGGSFTLTAANINGTPFQSYTYSTQSATTGSGAESPLAGTTVSVTPTAAGTFVYTLTATDAGCAASATASVLVNPLPAVIATATPSAVCSGDNIVLVANIPSANNGPFVIGAGAITGSGDYYNPFYHLFGGIKSQYIIRASELTAAGFTAGNFASVALNIGTVGSPYSGFTLHVGTTAATDLSAGLNAATLTQVYSNPSLVLTASSLNTFTFNTPYFWDGTSNLIVQLSWSNNNGGGTSSQVQYDNTAYVATAYYRDDNLTPAAILAGTPATGTRSTRPKMTLTMNQNNDYNWSWSPGAGLNTATATTSITNASGSAVTQAFTVTSTNIATGCVASVTTPLVTINSSVPAPVATNSTQCGTGVPTASVTGTGISGNTFSWYLVSTGGTAISGQTASSLIGYPITATTTFYVSEVGSGCSSPRTPVTVTVTPAPVISVAGTATICNGSSTSLTASSVNDPNYTYTWSGGLGTGATVSASPTVGTTYTVTGTDMSAGANAGCVTTATYAITVNPAPTTAPVVPATSTICAGDLQHLTSGPTTSTAIFGNGTTAPGNTAYPNPLSAYYGGAKHQLLFTASELTAQGLVAGAQISSITFDLNTFTGSACTNFTIRMGNTALTALTGFVAGTSTVYGPTTFTPTAAGLVTFTLTAPYTWNGTSNIVVETVHNAGNAGNGSGTRTNTTTTPTNTVYSAVADDVLGGIAGFDALTSWDENAASALRPNVRFVHTNTAPVWSPAASLYTDAAGTVAYTGTGTTSVYAKPTVTTTYVVTYTGSNGCTAQTSGTITVNQPTAASVAPVTACTSYTWPQTGLTYNTSGVYRDTISNAAGCDSVISLNLTINQPTTAIVNHTACQTYTWPLNGATYVTSGTHTAIISNFIGCDSVVTLNLTIGGPSASLVPVTNCGPYVWAQTGLTYNASGAFNDTIPNMYGCDSVITLSLTINQPSASTLPPLTRCTSYTWPQNGTTYLVSGAYTDTVSNALGCDSVITLNLTIIQPTTSSVPMTACTSYTWPQTGLTYNASGAYRDTIANFVGCDSIITLNLTINTPTSSMFTVSTCTPTYTWAQNGTVYNATGFYNDTILNAAGCDSVITLNLTITAFVATATDNGNATVTASTGTTYQWINCTTNAPISGATTQTFTATVNGTYAAIVSNGTCSDTTNCVTIANVGVKENMISSISVHPNPTHDVVIVTMDAATAIVEVMDVQGKLVQTTQINAGGQVDLSGYERGVYTLRIKTELGTAIERIVKN
ncbi:T9SS type A sorting domain-containing protein [Fluviicola taffensis]|nr:T9SS type A sorting domain-containing protein [Fluviicola taffensis]